MMPSLLVIMEITSPGHKTICLPFQSEAEYRKLITKGSTFREKLDELITKHPELFPSSISEGYWLHDSIHSKKLKITTRRIKLVANQAVYQIRPAFVLPYMVGMTDEVEKAMYLRRFGVPFEALAYVFGHDPSFWYRLYQGLGRLSIVGTTVKDPKAIPVNPLRCLECSIWQITVFFLKKLNDLRLGIRYDSILNRIPSYPELLMMRSPLQIQI